MSLKISIGSPLSMFTRSLLPNFSKSTVTEQIELLRNEVGTKVLPVYESATDADIGFRGRDPFKTKWNINADSQFMSARINLKNREFPYTPQNIVEGIYCICSTLDGRLKYLNELIDKSFSDEIVNEGLTFQQANLIRLSEMSEFYLIYARKLLIMIIHNEYEHLSPKVGKTQPLVKGDIQWIETNLNTFILLSRVWATDKEDFIRAVKSIPKMEIPEGTEEYRLAEKVHGKTIDPLSMNFIPYVFNPIYHVKNMVLHWRHHRIESAKAEREYIELRLQQYRLKRDGVDNAKMEQVIANTEERLKRLNKKIVDMEEDYAATYGA